MKIYGNLKLSGELQTYYDEIGTGGTGGTGGVYHHISNHYHDELSALIDIECEEGNVTVDNALTALNNHRIIVAIDDDHFVNPAFIKARPIGNTGVIIGGTDSLQSMEFINISTPSNSYNFADLYHDCYDSCAASNGPLDAALIFEYNSTYQYFIWQFSIKTGVDVSFFGRSVTVAAEPSACSNRTLDRIRVHRTTTSVYSYCTITQSESAQSGNAKYYRTTGSTSLSNSEADRALCYGGGVSGTYATGFLYGEYAAISTDAAGALFGQLSTTYGINDAASCSNGVYNRGIIAGGQKKQYESNWIDGDLTDLIHYVNISTLCDAEEFGSLNNAVTQHSMTDNNMQGIGVIIGGTDFTTNMEYISITTTGNASEFGELSNPRERHCSVSNG